ncbi:16S rRNA (adenine(1518)-N(6)/adenine(1519)-N(6))-dimethyltransferase RsmA [Capillibacterium thermochitinicola]|uniref:Ribosomal RNA small subunit methyltransferase A n=1 Tax=Capillibacterium thermochitinicola TaxID=2699427 RepID=A0A8J6LHY1_9FIRM|nr:16S rRNA (adenine(1518)-N(6)/adenine(1519)-N(6))-dimethyltransferase RsmA [Capillibacterium thermochitinicola]MBA2132031.1 ribosomal RNA small subunit methyltransferase A [Capillibacterium thermochitinicola]
MAKYQVVPKKGLGQNFLADANILRKIVDAAELTVADVVLEIGTGVGALTTALAQAAGRVITVETDRTLAPLLAEVLAGRDNVQLVFGDILKYDPAALLPSPVTAPKVVANLPYYITTPIIFHLLEAGVPWQRLVFLVQKEVADRMVSPPGNKVYGALSVMIQSYCHVELAGVVPPTVFIPRPKVHSAIVKLTPRPREFSPATARCFSLLVRTVFSSRRKNLYNSLRGIFSQLGGEANVMEALRALGLDPQQRGETLSPAEFYALADLCGKNLKGLPQT